LGVFTEYVRAAMCRAHYELEDGSYYGDIPGLQGVWMDAETLEGCREGLQEVLEEWILLGVALGHPIPPIGGVELKVPRAA
jgi:predicted RNase H-like HicB family nuclease